MNLAVTVVDATAFHHALDVFLQHSSFRTRCFSECCSLSSLNGPEDSVGINYPMTTDALRQGRRAELLEKVLDVPNNPEEHFLRHQVASRIAHPLRKLKVFRGRDKTCGYVAMPHPSEQPLKYPVSRI